MKRTIAILLVFLLCVGLSACTQKETGKEQKETGKEVEITIDNVSDYFGVEKTVEDFTCEKSGLFDYSSTITSASATICIRIYRKSECKVKDVSFNVGLLAYDGEVWESYDNLEFVSLPEDGVYEGRFKVRMKSGATAYEVLPYMPFKEPGYSFLWGDLKGSVIVPIE